MREEKLAIAISVAGLELDQAPDQIQPPFERILVRDVVGRGDKHLADERLGSTGGLPRIAVVGGHVSPPDHPLTLGLNRVLDQLLELRAALVLGRQEHHPDGVAAGRRQLDSGSHTTEERVGDLQQDARTVTGVGIRARSPAVLEVAEGLKALLDDGVGRLAPELGDQRDATGVVLVGRVVEATWPRHCGCLIHRGSRP